MANVHVATRPTALGRAAHLARQGERDGAKAIVFARGASVVTGENLHEVRSMLARLFDHLAPGGILGDVADRVSAGVGRPLDAPLARDEQA